MTTLYWLAGGVTTGLFAYLFVALFYPENFE